MSFGLAYVLSAVLCLSMSLNALWRRDGQKGLRLALILSTLGGGWLCLSMAATVFAHSVEEVLPWMASVRAGLSFLAAGSIGVAWILAGGRGRHVVPLSLGLGAVLAGVGVAVTLSAPRDTIQLIEGSWFSQALSIRLFDAIVTVVGSSAIAAGAVYRLIRGIGYARGAVIWIAIIPIAVAIVFLLVRLFGGAALDRTVVPLLIAFSSTSYVFLLQNFRVAGVGSDALALLFRHLPTPSVVIDLQTDSAILNPAARALFGEDRSPDRLVQRLGFTAPVGKGIVPSVRIEGVADRIFDLQFHSDAVKGMALIVLAEVTDRARKNEELAKALDGLRQMQDRLVQQEKMAALGILVAGVNHEINNPLAFVTSNLRAIRDYMETFGAGLPLARAVSNGAPGALDALRRWLESSELTEAIEDGPAAVTEAIDGCARIRDTVGSMRLLSRREEAEQIVDLAELARAGLKIGRTSFAPGIQVHAELDASVYVRGNPGELSRVVTNLVVNAGHALGDHGTIQVKLTIDQDSAVLTVRDDGPGIPPHLRKRIFEPFFTTKAPGEGTGLGLAISYEAVRRHGGDLRLVDREGPGACFEIRMPWADPGEISGSVNRLAG